MPQARSFDADQKTNELLDSPITIGERQFHPARMTPDVRRDQIAIQVRNAKLIREDALDRDATETDNVSDAQLDKRAASIQSLDQGLYEQIAVLIRDENDSPPAYEFLVANLDTRIGRELLTWLEGADDEGEPQAATIPAATGP